MARPGPSVGREEWQVLSYVADRHPVTVRDVADHMARASGKARTTVLTVMERLRGKGYLTRRKIGGVYHYAPRQSKGELTRQLIRDFVRDALGGSTSPFVAYLAGEAEVSPEEIEQLKRLVEGAEPRREEGTS
jgi:predicted transcriptional regulator